MEISWSQRRQPSQHTPRHSGWLDPDSSSDDASPSPRKHHTANGTPSSVSSLSRLAETAFSRRPGPTPGSASGLSDRGSPAVEGQAGKAQEQRPRKQGTVDVHRRASTSSTRRASTSSNHSRTPALERAVAALVHEGGEEGAPSTGGERRPPRQPIFESDEGSSDSDLEAGQGRGRRGQRAACKPRVERTVPKPLLDDDSSEEEAEGRRERRRLGEIKSLKHFIRGGVKPLNAAGGQPTAGQRNRRAGELGQFAGGPLRRINRLQAMLEHALDNLQEGLEGGLFQGPVNA